MSLHRRNPRRDVNEAGIIAALRSIGLIVLPLSGSGVPDLLVYSPQERRWLPIEVKVARGKLKPRQEALMANAPYPVVRSIPEALALFGVSG